jgi:hypothetical protein
LACHLNKIYRFFLIFILNNADFEILNN